MTTEAALATTDRTLVLAELAAQPLLMAAKFTSRHLAGTSAVIISPCEDGVSVSLFATTGHTAVRIIAEGICERRVEVPGEALAVFQKRFADAEFASIIQGQDQGLSIRMYSERETLSARCIERLDGPADDAIDRVMDEALSAECEGAARPFSRKLLTQALQSLQPIATIRLEQRRRGISVHFQADNFSGRLVVMGLNNQPE